MQTSFLPFADDTEPFDFDPALARAGNLNHDELLDALRGTGWRKSPELERVLGVDSRTIRAMASAAEGRVISGQQGYHLTADADLDEVRHAVARLRSQANEMNRRARNTEAERGL
tara:strand:- start:266 stop:610 length:345 start_codon:yes stop_codon:yes gene_type:complete